MLQRKKGKNKGMIAIYLTISLYKLVLIIIQNLPEFFEGVCMAHLRGTNKTCII